MTSEGSERRLPTEIVMVDANVLYSRVLRDYLVYAADEGIIAVRWSRPILMEVVKHLQANSSTFDDERAGLLIRLLNEAYPHAEIDPTEEARLAVDELDMPDEDDRHVLAAAVSARAAILCTNNVRDFPADVMAAVQIELLTADDLLSRLVTSTPRRMLAAHRSTVEHLPGATDRSTITALRRANAIRTAEAIKAVLEER